MNYTLSMLEQPQKEPVTLAEAKAHLNVESTFTDDDNLISSLIIVAREYCENFQNIKYITQEWALSLDAFPPPAYSLPIYPVQSIDAVKYIDSDGVEHNDFDTNKIILSRDGRIMLIKGESWPSIDLRPIGAVILELTTGYGDEATAVPVRVKQAMLLLISYWYSQREAASFRDVVQSVPFAVESLLWFDRRVPL